MINKARRIHCCHVVIHSNDDANNKKREEASRQADDDGGAERRGRRSDPPDPCVETRLFVCSFSSPSFVCVCFYIVGVRRGVPLSVDRISLPPMHAPARPLTGSHAHKTPHSVAARSTPAHNVPARTPVSVYNRSLNPSTTNHSPFIRFRQSKLVLAAPADGAHPALVCCRVQRRVGQQQGSGVRINRSSTPASSPSPSHPQGHKTKKNK